MNNNSEFMPVECLNVPKVLFYDKQYEDLSMHCCWTERKWPSEMSG